MTRRILLHVALCLIVFILSACRGGSNNTTLLPSDGKSITSYSFVSPASTGTINQTARTISVTVPNGTDVTCLVATFETDGAGVKVGPTVQASGSTPNDFTYPVSYSVTAQDGQSATYTVSVIVLAGPSAAKAITVFSFSNPSATGYIDEATRSISVSVPSGTDLRALIATFTTTGSSVNVGSTGQVSGLTPNDFTKPVLYVVTAQDNSTAIYTVLVSTGNYVHLESDAGDYIGGGQNYGYIQANAVIQVTASGGHLSVQITGNQAWWGNLQVPSTLTTLQTGTYDNVTRYPSSDPATGGLDWSGDGRGCSSVTGSFVVDSVSYTGGNLTAIDLHFEQHCEGWTPALHGQIHWTSNDTSKPPGPIDPPPAGLWQPAPGSTPATGNYVYLQSDAGDWVGYGGTYTYTQADARLTMAIDQFDGRLKARIEGDQNWGGDFLAMNTLTRLQSGYYGSVQRYPFNNPTVGGMDWGGEARGCNVLTGWFAVDSITYTNGSLTAFDLRFEQHCEGMTSALHGKIHWRSDDPTMPPGPVNPPPAGLWQPAPGSTPATGNYVYFESYSDIFAGVGRTYTYTQANSVLTVSESGGHLAVIDQSDIYVMGDFATMYTLTRLEPGYYGNLMRWPFNNPARGGLDWGVDTSGCNTLTGWFVVDSVTYTNGTLTAIDLRFDEYCDGLSGWRGQIHWRSDDSTAPPGPVNPPPAGLWQPAPGSTPSTGNYVYLQSDAGDWIGQGLTYTFTPDTTLFDVYTNVGYFGLTIGNREWYGDFQAMYTLTELQPGYYGNLGRFPFQNPATGGLSWWGDGRGCNEISGWFVVDSVSYNGINLKSIDLRFEQHCDGSGPALHGQIHWVQ